MTQSCEIRAPGPGERAAWEPLWRGYLAFYKTALADEVTTTTWERLHDPQEPMFLLGAYVEGSLVGIVHYILHRSTWSIGGYCYLQDLFVAPASRGHRVGRALIEAVYAKAQEAGATRVYWLTHETNYRGRELYDKVAENAGFIQYRKTV
ncbi:MAG: GNAT family N-acetyltransferase [Variibacter sp.]|nr:GNAT family N-acetyltransferase [Variibacter sp.]